MNFKKSGKISWRKNRIDSIRELETDGRSPMSSQFGVDKVCYVRVVSLQKHFKARVLASIARYRYFGYDIVHGTLNARLFFLYLSRTRLQHLYKLIGIQIEISCLHRVSDKKDTTS